MNIINDIIDKVEDMAESLINFDEISVVTLKETADKFGVWDDVMNTMPELMRSKLNDGTLSDEDVKSMIPMIKELILNKINSSKI